MSTLSRERKNRTVRISDQEVDLMAKAAGYSGACWSSWMRQIAIERARQVMREHPPLRGEAVPASTRPDEPTLWERRE